MRDPLTGDEAKCGDRQRSTGGKRGPHRAGLCSVEGQKPPTRMFTKSPLQLPNSELWRTSVQPMLDEFYQTEKA